MSSSFINLCNFEVMVKEGLPAEVKAGSLGSGLRADFNDIHQDGPFVANCAKFDREVDRQISVHWVSLRDDLQNLRAVKGVFDRLKRNTFFRVQSERSGDELGQSMENAHFIESQESICDADGDVPVDSDDEEVPAEQDMDETMNEIVDEEHDSEFEDTFIVEGDDSSTQQRQSAKFETALVELYAVNIYFRFLGTKKAKPPIRAYFSTLSCQILEDISEPFRDRKHGFTVLFDHEILQKRLHAFLIATFTYPTKSQIDSLVRFYTLYTQIQESNVQDFIQLFVCKELFQKREYHLIHKSIKDCNIHRPQRVSAFKLKKIDFFNHYYFLAKSCLVTNNYTLAYELFQVMFALGDGVKLKEDVGTFIMCDYVLVLMKLERFWKNADSMFLKYHSLCPMELIETYQNFGMNNYSMFVKSYLRFATKCLPVDPHDKITVRDSNMIVSQKTMYDRGLLKQLCISLLKRKLRLLQEKIGEPVALKSLVCDESINEINSILGKLDITVNLKKISTGDAAKDRVTPELLLKKTLDITNTNNTLRQLLDGVDAGIKRVEMSKD